MHAKIAQPSHRKQIFGVCQSDVNDFWLIRPQQYLELIVMLFLRRMFDKVQFLAQNYLSYRPLIQAKMLLLRIRIRRMHVGLREHHQASHDFIPIISGLSRRSSWEPQHLKQRNHFLTLSPYVWWQHNQAWNQGISERMRRFHQVFRV